jgi:hypothetical protein
MINLTLTGADDTVDIADLSDLRFESFDCI